MTISISSIQNVAANATTSANAAITRSTPDTLETARNKVVTKLKANIAYVNNNMQPVNAEKLDLLFKQSSSNVYKIGAKYGNRWLKQIIENEHSFIANVKKAELVDMLQLLVTAVEGKQTDAAITAVMEANVAAHNKRAA